MLFIVDALPNYCANCGTGLAPAWQGENRRDVISKASQVCGCGAKWQLVERNDLLVAADAGGGDLRRYA